MKFFPLLSRKSWPLQSLDVHLYFAWIKASFGLWMLSAPGHISVREESEQRLSCKQRHPAGATAQVAKCSSLTIKQLHGKTVNMKSYGNLTLRLNKQIWHQTFCPAQAGDEAATFTVTLKWNALYSQPTVFVEEYLINGLPSHVFPSQKLIVLRSMHLSTQLNVYLDTECHILTWGQCQTLLGWGEEKLISWTNAEITVWREGCF